METHKTRALLNVVDECWVMSFNIMRLHRFGRRTCEKLQYLSKLTYMSYYFNTVALFHRLWSTHYCDCGGRRGGHLGEFIRL